MAATGNGKTGASGEGEGRSGGEVRAAWIEAARLRTLPLAASGSFIAAGLAATAGAFRVEVFALMFVVSILLQVIANFADDYGDLAHGLDDETRVGPKRGMQRGIITPPQMRRALIGACTVTFALGCILIYVAFTGGPALGAGAVTAMAVFLALGVAAIAAAVLYTVGPHPYGYLGLGDVMSFLFFGIVAVVAGSFLYVHQVTAASVVAALALGLPVAAVMNINNMRDSLADAAKGKRTIANRLYAAGERKGSQLVEEKKPEEIAAIAAVLEHGPRVDGKKVDEQLKCGGAEAVARATDPARVAALMGEVNMRTYHKALVIISQMLFIVAGVLVFGPSAPAIWLTVAITFAAIPLRRATDGVVRQLDHTKLDRFMAPTSLGTVLVALAFSVGVAIAAAL